MFTMDCASGTNSPVVSLSNCNLKPNGQEKESSQNAKFPADVLLSLSKDACFTVHDSVNGLIINSCVVDQKQLSAISMYVIGK